MDFDIRRLDAARRGVRSARRVEFRLFRRRGVLAARLGHCACRLVRLGVARAGHRLVGAPFRHRAAKLAAQSAHASPRQPFLFGPQDSDRIKTLAVVRPGAGAVLLPAILLDALNLLRDPGRDLRFRLLWQIPRARIEGFAVAGSIGAGSIAGAENAVAPAFPLQHAARHLVADAPRRGSRRADDRAAERPAALDAGECRGAGDVAPAGAGISRKLPGDRKDAIPRPVAGEDGYRAGDARRARA